MRDRERHLSPSLVEVVPGAHNGHQEAAADREHDDRELEDEDLRRQPPGRAPVRRGEQQTRNRNGFTLRLSTPGPGTSTNAR